MSCTSAARQFSPLSTCAQPPHASLPHACFLSKNTDPPSELVFAFQIPKSVWLLFFMLKPLHSNSRSHCLAAFREIQSTLGHNKSHAGTLENLSLFYGAFLTEICLTEIKKKQKNINVSDPLGPYIYLSFPPPECFVCLGILLPLKIWNSRKRVGGRFFLFETPNLCSIRQKATEHCSWPFLICFCSCSSMRLKVISYAHHKGWILSWCEQAQDIRWKCVSIALGPKARCPRVTPLTAMQTEGCTN